MLYMYVGRLQTAHGTNVRIGSRKAALICSESPKFFPTRAPTQTLDEGMSEADGVRPVVQIRILRNVADLVRTADLQQLTHRGVREWLRTHLGLEAGTHYSKVWPASHMHALSLRPGLTNRVHRALAQAWLKTEVDSLLSERRAPEQGAAASARTAARRVRQVEVDAADEEERELRRLEGGMPPAGGGGSGMPLAAAGSGGKDKGGSVPPVTSADVDSVLAFYADPKAASGRRRRKPQQPAGRAVGLDHLVSLALAALADHSRQGSRAAQVCAEVRRRFPQICASYMEGGSGRVNASWRAQVEEVLRTRKDLFARKVQGVRPATPNPNPNPNRSRITLPHKTLALTLVPNPTLTRCGPATPGRAGPPPRRPPRAPSSTDCGADPQQQQQQRQQLQRQQQQHRCN